MIEKIFLCIIFHLTVTVYTNLSEDMGTKKENEVLDKNNLKLWPNLNYKSGSTQKSKIELLADIFRNKIKQMKYFNETELIILVDGSSSIGNANFISEMKYIQKIVSDMHLGPSAVRLAVVTYSSHVKVHVNHLKTKIEEYEKCSLLHYRLPSIKYPGGSTNTRAALLETERILSQSRANAQKVVFLVTDGFSNKGNPIPIAEHLKKNRVAIYTFGIENGNVEELQKIASRPVQEYSYLFESFGDFESFERRALHQDLKPGTYVDVKNSSLCDLLCENPGGKGCCDSKAKCSCGTSSGHFACLCPPGYYGTGLFQKGCKLCPNGTYSDGTVPGDVLTCYPCPDKHHITLKSPANSKADCVCSDGYIPDGDICQVITCPEIQPPKNGYFVKKTCSSVLNAACGIRCHMGFTLIGSSVRICQKNKTWSGTAPVCVPKVCKQIKPVDNSELICTNEEDNSSVMIRYNATGHKVKHSELRFESKNNDDDETLGKFKKLVEFDSVTNQTLEINYTVGTECKYSCLPGYFLVGSKSRSCLPMLKWSGLQNTCKAIRCPSLQKIENGTVTPKNCTLEGVKHKYADVCEYSCNPGYELQGPNVTNCTGRHGSWSTKNRPTKCIDVEPPKLACPQNIVVHTDVGVHYATINFSLPIATDNSGKEPIIWSKPPIEKDYPLKFIIGESEIQIYSVDDYGNYAFCSFNVSVIDTESPKILECESPPVFYISEFPSNSTEIKWKEPIVDDNSGVPIPLSRYPSTSEFPLGVTTILYTATDYSGNNASCNLNITIMENPCSERPTLTNTRWDCTRENESVSCIVSCSEGFGFVTSATPSNVYPDDSDSLLLNCTYSGRKAFWSPDIFHGDIDLFPECSETEEPNEILEEIELDVSEEFCNDLKNFSTEISNELIPDSQNNSMELFFACEDEIPEDLENEKIEEDTNVIRRRKRTVEHEKRKRKGRKKKLRISFVAKDQSLGKEPSKNISKTEEKVKKFYEKYGSEKERPEKLYIRTNVRRQCKQGSLLKNNLCIKCPKGTFHNLTTATCDPCPIGQYQEVEGQTKCFSCPIGYSTKKIRRKHLNQCKKICTPGTFGRRKFKSGLALEPCTPCPIGYFQPSTGETSCKKCPEDSVTIKRGSNSLSECIKKLELEDLCFRLNCRNGGTCFVSDGFALCKCPPGFLGSFCERKLDPCGFNPCYNNGQCDTVNAVEFKCRCPEGFEGELCEKEVNECASNPCGAHGECIDLLNSFNCNCFTGFKGDTCNERINLCEELEPCLNSGTCIEVDASYKCLCSQDYTGSHCEESTGCYSNGSSKCNENPVPEPPDACWNISCGRNKQCFVQRNQPLCVCLEGFRGENCSEIINPNVILNFPKYGVTDYVSFDVFQKDFQEITICMWINTKDNFNYGTLFSYSTLNEDNSFTLTDYSGLVLYVEGRHVVTDLTANDGFWHFICTTWQGDGGVWKIYLDGSMHTSGNGLSNGSVIPGGGKLIIGQEQDFFGGGFNELESFAGQLTKVEVWNRVLDSSEIKINYENCHTSSETFISWSQFLHSIHGNILEEESRFCTACPKNLTLFRGEISYEESGLIMIAKYECEEGFFFKFDSDSGNVSKVNLWHRKCLKHGNWEPKEPKCIRISCGFPGYLYSGIVIGDSFLFGDIIEYSCDGDYTLIGNNTRICQANGKWSGKAPICQGNSNTCRKLVPPRHASMFVYFNHKKPYGKTLPSVGDQIEFTCDKGYRLKGFGMLTCLNGGIWDREPPTCQKIQCQYPKIAAHLLDANITNSTLFYYGDSLTVTCASGIKKFIVCDQVGGWNYSSSICDKKCFGEPQPPENGFIFHDSRRRSYDTFDEGETVAVKCRPGFLSLGDTRFQCSNSGTWTQYWKTVCERLNCGPPPIPHHPYYIAHVEGYYFSQRVFLNCSNGYRKSGDIIIQCTANGTWTEIPNKCNKNICALPELPEGFSLKIQKKEYFYQDVLQIDCPFGKKLQNRVMDFIVCQSNGTWSKIPECI